MGNNKEKLASFLLLVSSALLLGACAGPKAPPSGPVYYVSEGVTKVVLGEEEGQIACGREDITGSHVSEARCYTAQEIAARHYRDARNTERFGLQRCIEPGLCKK